MIIKCDSGNGCIGLLWTRLLRHLLVHGKIRSPRGLCTRECLGVQLRLNNPRLNILSFPARDLNSRHLISEWLWIMAGRSDLATLAKYNSQIKRISDHGTSLAGASLPRLLP